MPHGPLRLKAKLCIIVTAYTMEFATTFHPPPFAQQSLDIPNYMVWATETSLYTKQINFPLSKNQQQVKSTQLFTYYLYCKTLPQPFT